MANKSITVGERRKTRRFFNLVALIYPFIERNLDPAYNQALDRLTLDRDLDVLDLATGTGILAGSFAERGHRVQGLDFAENLLRRARRRYPEVHFRNFDLADLAEIPDESHDIVCMGFLLHGLDAEFRQQILIQAARIAARYVLVCDYGRPGNWFVRFIEWIEGPHYPAFLAAARGEEFARAGLAVRKEIPFRNFGTAWLCERRDDAAGQDPRRP